MYVSGDLFYSNSHQHAEHRVQVHKQTLVDVERKIGQEPGTDHG